MERPVDAEKFVERLFKLVESFPGQPIALVGDEDGVKVGVINILYPDDQDWCLNPVELEQFSEVDQ